MTLEPTGHVVRVQKRDLGGLGQAITAQHFDVCPRDEIDGSAPEWCCGNSIDRLRTLHRHRRVGGKEGGKMFRDADGPELKHVPSAKRTELGGRRTYPTPGPPPPWGLIDL